MSQCSLPVSLSDYYSYTPQEQQIFLSSLDSSDYPQFCSLPYTTVSCVHRAGTWESPTQGSDTNPSAGLGMRADGPDSPTEGGEMGGTKGLMG